MRTRFYLCVLLAAALASSFGALRVAPANPLVGVWTILLPDVPGGDLTYLDVRRDGNYMLYSKVTGIGQEGTFTVTPPDHWRLVARTTSYADAGTYRLEGKKYLYLTGKLGTGKWTRVTRSPYFPEQMKSGQLVPKDIPSLVQALVANARKRWRPDAIPVTLDVSDGNPVGTPMPTYGVPYFKVTVTVYSPSARSGWYVTVSPFSYRVTRLPAGNPPPTQPLAAEFVDLPRAIAAARHTGSRCLHQAFTFLMAPVQSGTRRLNTRRSGTAPLTPFAPCSAAAGVEVVPSTTASIRILTADRSAL